MFSQFEEGGLLSKYRNGTEIGDKYDKNLTLPPFISKDKMDEMSSVNKYDAKPMFMYMLEDICDGIQSHPSINRRESRYKIRNIIKKM